MLTCLCVWASWASPQACYLPTQRPAEHRPTRSFPEVATGSSLDLCAWGGGVGRTLPLETMETCSLRDQPLVQAPSLPPRHPVSGHLHLQGAAPQPLSRQGAAPSHGSETHVQPVHITGSSDQDPECEQGWPRDTCTPLPKPAPGSRPLPTPAPRPIQRPIPLCSGQGTLQFGACPFHVCLPTR